jgi:hypothetical protein
MNRFVLPLIFALVAIAEPCGAAAIVQKKESATLEVRFDADQPTIALADEINVALSVEGPADLFVLAPLEWATTDRWQQLDRSEPTREPIGSGRIRWRVTYRFAPREPGELQFAFPPVKFRAGTEAEQTVAWAPILFTVTAKGGDLLDITAVEQMPPIAPPDRSWQLGIAVAVSCLCLIALLLVLRRLRHAVPRTPAQLALHEWDRLLALKLPEQGRSERFITLLTTLLRRYLERQYTMPARRRTTPEFVQSLAALGMMSAEEKQFLARFLERCEAVKFAGVPMSADECSQLAQAVRHFLQHPSKTA